MNGEPVDQSRREFIGWLWRIPLLAALAGGGWAAWRYYSVHNARRPASATPAYVPAERVTVGELAQFSQPWTDVAFAVDGVPAVALSLPQAVPHGVTEGGINVAAYSRVCTHQSCLVDLNRDPEAVAFAFNYRSDSPSLVCPCHLSVFAPLSAGESVSGPAMFPLPRVRLAVEDGTVYATGVEPDPLAGG